MKKILNYIYNKPIIFSILFNILSVFIFLISINKDNYYLLAIFICLIFMNKMILENGGELNKRKRVIILLGYFSMITICFLSNKYINFIR